MSEENLEELIEKLAKVNGFKAKWKYDDDPNDEGVLISAAEQFVDFLVIFKNPTSLQPFELVRELLNLTPEAIRLTSNIEAIRNWKVSE
jgi:hypothetical protein